MLHSAARSGAVIHWMNLTALLLLGQGVLEDVEAAAAGRRSRRSLAGGMATPNWNFAASLTAVRLPVVCHIIAILPSRKPVRSVAQSMLPVGMTLCLREAFLINDIEVATAQLWVRGDQGIKSFADLKGKRRDRDGHDRARLP
nr:hypothetical protein [Bradyrhizobium stylosanthis]